MRNLRWLLMAPNWRRTQSAQAKHKFFLPRAILGIRLKPHHRRSSYNPKMLRMMCVTAHPDDEAGNFGGTLRLCSERGVETAVLCLTPGQAAFHRGAATND